MANRSFVACNNYCIISTHFYDGGRWATHASISAIKIIVERLRFGETAHIPQVRAWLDNNQHAYALMNVRLNGLSVFVDGGFCCVLSCYQSTTDRPQAAADPHTHTPEAARSARARSKTAWICICLCWRWSLNDHRNMRAHASACASFRVKKWKVRALRDARFFDANTYQWNIVRLLWYVWRDAKWRGVRVECLCVSCVYCVHLIQIGCDLKVTHTNVCRVLPSNGTHTRNVYINEWAVQMVTICSLSIVLTS